jgi:hypothetical protein
MATTSGNQPWVASYGIGGVDQLRQRRSFFLHCMRMAGSNRINDSVADGGPWLLVNVAVAVAFLRKNSRQASSMAVADVWSQDLRFVWCLVYLALLTGDKDGL